MSPTPGSGELARRIMRRHARSFSWAARLLPAQLRADAAILYAWCRRCDDAVDRAPDPGTAQAALVCLREELDLIYGPAALGDPVLAGMQDLVARRGLPRFPADELLDGMAMDLGRVRYQSRDELLVYCHRVAGTVGLMMAHLMGVRDPRALRRADDLGIAMQLTNICRDVAEDQQRDRVYVPAELLGPGLLPSEAGPRLRTAIGEMLRWADDFYRSGDAGLPALPAACAGAIRAARLIYADIGRVIARRGYDVLSGRVVVSRARKLWLIARALFGTLMARAWPSPAGGRAAL